MSNSKIHLTSLGCAKNLVDSEKILGLLSNNNFDIVDNIKKADIEIINTCGFVLDAKKESIDEIMNAIELKMNGNLKKVIVVGCLSQRYKEELEKEIPEVDVFFGTEAYYDIIKYLNSSTYSDYLFQRKKLSEKHYSYLKISEGCDHKCAFCAIPLIRGKHRSVPIENLIEETKILANNGTKELLVVAQDTTYYGYDLYKKRKISYLLNKLSEVEGIEWIKLFYTYPTNFPKDLLKTIAENPKINKYIDIPLQHISDNMLKAMKRGISKAQIIDLINEIRDTIPEVVIRSTFIVGFPDETEDDFNELMEFIENYKLDNVGFFRYSHEEGTTAWKKTDNIDDETKFSRYISLMELQREIALEKNRKYIGKKVKVLYDEKIDGEKIARTSWQAPEVDPVTLLDDDKKLYKGKFYDVEIIDVQDYDLIAKIL
ncbi:MAG TPA: 30S ribosomal protein S12 methylthiotransferase RimO [Ignavibacteriales bacterium]|nr:30S ribosomal protein S12 methylthiotransferase RimO [Ignavibacteriales bacterium]HOL81770.1 30S ribosomal protein S12 methylthiotransferase RimO [Ignavibacteriales bacterium]HOM65671.1 30S ribosomal protein S12 methylthiotransferase RimO [Ignavibacteriales bacterium]HPD67367.1 30S ribosomal protein S12 methylthiotransferase RimO [Ignavibacteriales bacterium]HPP32892.1 30S ribosomal protein S12 methylthiotransferase RimO [Ignavibacteriales bacterium]